MKLYIGMIIGVVIGVVLIIIDLSAEKHTEVATTAYVEPVEVEEVVEAAEVEPTGNAPQEVEEVAVEEVAEVASDIQDDGWMNLADADFLFRGTLASYPILLGYTHDVDGLASATLVGVLDFNNNDNLIRLKGEERNDGSVVLEVFTPNGYIWGRFSLRKDDEGNLRGSYTDLENNNEYEVNLTPYTNR